MPNLEFPPNLRITSIRRKPVKATAAMPTTTYTCTIGKYHYKPLKSWTNTQKSHTKPNAIYNTTKGTGHRLCLYHCPDFLNYCFYLHCVGFIQLLLTLRNRCSSGVSGQITEINERKQGTETISEEIEQGENSETWLTATLSSGGSTGAPSVDAGDRQRGMNREEHLFMKWFVTEVREVLYVILTHFEHFLSKYSYSTFSGHLPS